MSDNKGDTALHNAVMCHQLDAVSSLVSQGTNLNKQDSRGRTPLHLAVERNYKDVVGIILYSKGNNILEINQRNKEGLTPLHIACWKGYTDIVELLLQQTDIDVRVVNKVGLTPLHLASLCGHTDIVELLLQQTGIDVRVVDNDGWTPLHMASEGGHTDIVELLQQTDTNPNQGTHKGDTPLHLAVQGCMIGAKVNEPTVKCQHCGHPVIETVQFEDKEVQTVVAEPVETLQFEDKEVQTVVAEPVETPTFWMTVRKSICCKLCTTSQPVASPQSENMAPNLLQPTPSTSSTLQPVDSQKLEEADLLKVSRQLGSNWWQVGIFLGLESARRDIISNSYPTDIERQSFQMLQYWSTHCDPENRTVNTLKRALTEAGCFNALKYLPSDVE